jgi:putative N-acetylmannosamine-6-phosphate epimerase
MRIDLVDTEVFSLKHYADVVKKSAEDDQELFKAIEELSAILLSEGREDLVKQINEIGIKAYQAGMSKAAMQVADELLGI